jgi:hypothetical protein
VSSYAKHGGSGRAARVLRRWVGTQGGAGGATSGSRGAISSGQRLGGLLVRIADSGLTSAFEDAGLGRLVGHNRLQVLEGLLEAIAGDGSDLDQQAVRAAICDIYDELFVGDTFEELENTTLDGDAVVNSLEDFLAAYIYRKLLPAIDAKLRDLDADTARSRERELREYIKSLVKLRVKGDDALSLDWEGSAGQQLIEGVVQAAFEQVEQLDDE